MNRKMNFALLFVLGFLYPMLFSCSNQNQANSFVTNSNNVITNTSVQNISQNTHNQKTSDMKEAKFENYNYHYKKENERTVAMFTEKFLPRDDIIVVGAIRDVIRRAYNEEAAGSPSLKKHGGFNKIHLESKKNDFYVNPVKQDTGEVHSLIIEREPK